MMIIRTTPTDITVRFDKEDIQALEKELKEGSPIFFKLFDLIHMASESWPE